MRQVALGDLREWPDHEQGPIWSRIGELSDQIEVESLVQDTVVPHNRALDVEDVSGPRKNVPCLTKVRGIDTRRRAECPWVPLAARRVQARASGKDEIGLPVDRLFALPEVGR